MPLKRVEVLRPINLWACGAATVTVQPELVLIHLQDLVDALFCAVPVLEKPEMQVSRMRKIERYLIVHDIAKDVRNLDLNVVTNLINYLYVSGHVLSVGEDTDDQQLHAERQTNE